MPGIASGRPLMAGDGCTSQGRSAPPLSACHRPRPCCAARANLPERRLRQLLLPWRDPLLQRRLQGHSHLHVAIRVHPEPAGATLAPRARRHVHGLFQLRGPFCVKPRPAENTLPLQTCTLSAGLPRTTSAAKATRSASTPAAASRSSAAARASAQTGRAAAQAPPAAPRTLPASTAHAGRKVRGGTGGACTWEGCR